MTPAGGLPNAVSSKTYRQIHLEPLYRCREAVGELIEPGDRDRVCISKAAEKTFRAILRRTLYARNLGRRHTSQPFELVLLSG